MSEVIFWRNGMYLRYKIGLLLLVTRKLYLCVTDNESDGNEDIDVRACPYTRKFKSGLNIHMTNQIFFDRHWH